MSYDNTAENIQQEESNVTEITKPKRERKPKLDAEGNAIPRAERKPKEPKAPKLWPQWNEDGSPLLDSDGEQVMLETRMKKPRAPKAPRLDADGNPIVRTVTVMKDEMVIRRTEKADDFKARETSKRGQMFAAATDGKTVGEFFEEMGGRSVAATFLSWFINEAEVITVE